MLEDRLYKRTHPPLTNFIQNRISYEYDSRSASQDIPRLPFMKPKVSLPCSRKFTIGPYTEPVLSSPIYLRQKLIPSI